MADQRPRSAIPPVAARAIGFSGILVGGLLGGVLGYLLVRVQCDGQCGVPLGLGILIGSLVVTAGAAVLTVLTMRAMGEWRNR